MKDLDLYKAHGSDDTSFYVLKAAAETLDKPLAWLVRHSVEERSVPGEWKRENIVPIFNKGDREKILNYR